MKLSVKKMSELSGLSEQYIQMAIDAKYIQDVHYSDGIIHLPARPEELAAHRKMTKEYFKPESKTLEAEKVFKQFLEMPRGQRLFSARTALEILKVSRGFKADDPIPLSDQVELEKLIVRDRKPLRK